MLELKPYTPPKCDFCKTKEPKLEIEIGIDGTDQTTRNFKACFPCAEKLAEKFNTEFKQAKPEEPGPGRDCENCECTTCENPICTIDDPCQDYETCTCPVTECGAYTGNGGGASE